MINSTGTPWKTRGRLCFTAWFRTVKPFYATMGKLGSSAATLVQSVMFAYTAQDQWQPGIGDPSVMGWVTVLSYFMAAVLCWNAGRASRHATPNLKGPRVFWSVLVLGLALLGVNKQLDLQTWFTLFAKHLALHEGWYQQRRAIQGAFIGAVALGGAAGLVGMRVLAGQATRPIWLALAGTLFLGCFILIRASSFHHADQMLGFKMGGLKVNWILELGSIALIGTAAWLARRLPRPSDGRGVG